ncbi:hypothetical protein ADL22_12680 [Streptomyces sp. NRRL F-4489]|uniref:hypothetical protein n=1 Tax=Streptomyces sp. NRRL F-4489 TaxID=1609095 RepID=UPI000749BCB3|nr:hypothetical protein [Streptomyces sp. NRRL F-4489]KUL44792.1 hypothetical protein ADL22_12680 [Streptomyces sp. NRRL F-4489]
MSEETLARRTTKQVLETARLCIEALVGDIALHSSVPGVCEYAACLLEARDDVRVPQHLLPFLPQHPEVRRSFMAAARDNAIHRLWSRSKVVYAMDDLMLHYLAQSSVSEIPTSVLQDLPHANPFILLPKPEMNDPEIAYFRTHIGVPLGAMVFGRFDNARRLCSTADERREDLGLMFVGWIDDEEKGRVFQTLRCTVPLRHERLTVDDVVNETVAKFHFSKDLGEDDNSKLESWLRRYVTQVFNSLLYVCTDQPDTEVYQPSVNRTGKTKSGKKQRRPRPGDIDTVVKVGFRLGPALHAAKRQSDTREKREGEGTGHRQRPHQRKGHWRTFWTGPGREIEKLKWVRPYWVSTDLLGDGDTPNDVVIRPVTYKEKKR